ncbi:4-hydroxythreonine-4-phosphate dehydrogenase PdxA [Halobacteriovorax sp. JY17]|uniref:PdxA family dehydrogenase n=1 Tax=Halobacteriovorax sp. JY17 TaxID=2014617 RepID=UPI000C6B6FD5|nr:4-hydroxythreonine-4-phosphate dehydrogenase PdxA [Halobacteriovorax sp. JY17]PIK14351.1 MAG: hypothetical protein CES88_08370 [Halobacteriovorax sp. JY17]
MIYITQGHELGIGIEVFLKSFSLLNSTQQKSFTLIASKETVENNLQTLSFDYQIHGDRIVYNSNLLHFIDFPKSEIPESTSSLNIALNKIQSTDILLTLPTSKDQLIDNGELKKGYTEFLRHRYMKANLCMVFKAFQDTTLLITDHIPLSEVGKVITSQMIKEKIEITLKGLSEYFHSVSEVIVSGINPHCGEGGLLGTEDQVIAPALKKIHNVRIVGPISGDTLHFHTDSNKAQLKVYMYHDQGLPQFKDKYRTIGLNITLGLPFLRMSVDHGTAFDLFGKNIADFSGCFYMLKEAIKVHRKITHE